MKVTHITTLFAFSLFAFCQASPQNVIAKQIRHWIYRNIAYDSKEETRDLIENFLDRKFPKLSFLVIVYPSDFSLNTDADVQISR